MVAERKLSVCLRSLLGVCSLQRLVRGDQARVAGSVTTPALCTYNSALRVEKIKPHACCDQFLAYCQHACAENITTLNERGMYAVRSGKHSPDWRPGEELSSSGIDIRRWTD